MRRRMRRKKEDEDGRRGGGAFVRFATYEHNHCVMTITIAS
jgi:hypothetical protein